MNEFEVEAVTRYMLHNTFPACCDHVMKNNIRELASFHYVKDGMVYRDKEYQEDIHLCITTTDSRFAELSWQVQALTTVHSDSECIVEIEIRKVDGPLHARDNDRSAVLVKQVKYSVAWTSLDGMETGQDYLVSARLMKYLKMENKTCHQYILSHRTQLFRPVLGTMELSRLYKKAVEFATPDPGQVVHVLYRNKPEDYYRDIFDNFNGVMYPYMKDFNGDAGCPINGQIEGLFFGGRTDRNGTLPTQSPFGDTRFVIPVEKLFNTGMNLYFADFYCHYMNHYVTVVLTEPCSYADVFCRKHLLPLAVLDNPFFMLTLDNKYWMSKKLFVEVFYTQPVDLNLQMTVDSRCRMGKTYIVGRGYSKVEGISKNPNCNICNLYQTKRKRPQSPDPKPPRGNANTDIAHRERTILKAKRKANKKKTPKKGNIATVGAAVNIPRKPACSKTPVKEPPVVKTPRKMAIVISDDEACCDVRNGNAVANGGGGGAKRTKQERSSPLNGSLSTSVAVCNVTPTEQEKSGPKYLNESLSGSVAVHNVTPIKQKKPCLKTSNGSLYASVAVRNVTLIRQEKPGLKPFNDSVIVRNVTPIKHKLPGSTSLNGSLSASVGVRNVTPSKQEKPSFLNVSQPGSMAVRNVTPIKHELPGVKSFNGSLSGSLTVHNVTPIKHEFPGPKSLNGSLSSVAVCNVTPIKQENPGPKNSLILPSSLSKSHIDSRGSRKLSGIPLTGFSPDLTKKTTPVKAASSMRTELGGKNEWSQVNSISVVTSRHSNITRVGTPCASTLSRCRNSCADKLSVPLHNATVESGIRNSKQFASLNQTVAPAQTYVSGIECTTASPSLNKAAGVLKSHISGKENSSSSNNIMSAVHSNRSDADVCSPWSRLSRLSTPVMNPNPTKNNHSTSPFDIALVIASNSNPETPNRGIYGPCSSASPANSPYSFILPTTSATTSYTDRDFLDLNANLNPQVNYHKDIWENSKTSPDAKPPSMKKLKFDG